jgi:hypothetical protein
MSVVWIATTCGAVNSAYVIRIERDTDGTVLHLTDGSTARSSLQFSVLDGQLIPIEPVDDDDECPF